MSNKDTKQTIEIKPEALPTIDIFGAQVTIPTSSLNTVLLLLLCVLKVKEALDAGTKGLKLALTALDRSDIAIIDAMDDLAVEIRETTNADRVIFLLMHNGTSNTVYHWKRVSCMSESVRVGIQPISKQLQSVMIPSILTETDYDLYKKINAGKQFVHLHVDNAIISRKHRNFILDTGMFGHYIRALVDEDTNKAYGAVLIQYSTSNEFLTKWSPHTYDTVQNKLDRLYNLLSKRTETQQFKVKVWLEQVLRFYK